MSHDTLSDVLKTVRIAGAVFFEITAGEDWSIGALTPDVMLPRLLPNVDHLAAFHAVTAGHCYGALAGGEAMRLEAGDVIVFPRADAHVMSSAPGLPHIQLTADEADSAAAGGIAHCIQFGCSGQVRTKIVCGYLACDASPFNMLLDNLPRVIKGARADDGRDDGLNRLFRYALTEMAEKRPGSSTVLTKLSELMLIDLLRNYIETLPDERAGWLAGLRDPSVGRALALLHADPAQEWTIESLGKAVGVSRSVLAERFAELVGIPPMAYLATWRMQVAADMLGHGKRNMAEIAEKIGYDSEASFSRAFKKRTGVPPSQWRQRGAAKSG